MNIDTDFSWEKDAFDTEVLGFKVAKITHIDSDPIKNLEKRVKELVLELEKEKIFYATYRISSENFALIHALERVGFLLVDGFISLKKNFDSFTEERQKDQIREAKQEDIKSLIALGRKVFSKNRLYNDPFIPKEKADLFYSKWVENCVLGKAADLVLVWEEDEKIIAFVCLKKNGHIPLIGVDEAYRGKGIAKQLLLASFPYFFSWNVREVSIGTQIGNIPAVRAYSACGFSAQSTLFTFAWHG